jgi:septal ring factor EnvC (AmiA/AmiB activator)
MSRFDGMIRFFCIGLLVAGPMVMVGCTTKPSNQETSKLEESRGAVESAERKLAELRQERIRLEKELQAKQGEIKKTEQEKDSLQNTVK